MKRIQISTVAHDALAAGALMQGRHSFCSTFVPDSEGNGYIEVDDDVLDFLDDRRIGDESYSDVILWLLEIATS